MSIFPGDKILKHGTVCEFIFENFRSLGTEDHEIIAIEVTTMENALSSFTV